MESIIDFLEPVNLQQLSEDEGFFDTQLGKHIRIYDTSFPDLENCDLVLVGCQEYRGGGIPTDFNAANLVRQELYKLFYWHDTVTVADIGNAKKGAGINDSYFALQIIISELIEKGIKVLVIGGSHDVTLAQYGAYRLSQKVIEATCVDAKIDLNMSSPFAADNFLMEFLTGEPNYVKHYNHIGYQSYFVHPQMLETIHKLGFDCIRVGKARENILEIEPNIRNSNLLTFDISAIQHGHAPASKLSPNGFSGEDTCAIFQYAGMSKKISSMGIYGFIPEYDKYNLTAKQLSQAIWYLIDGIYKGKLDDMPDNRDQFNDYNVVGEDFQILFLEHRKTGKWWMQTHDLQFIACSYNDYRAATNNEIPERWLRFLERAL